MPEPAVLLPPDTVLGFRVGRLGPTRDAEFEGWPQDPDNPFELMEGWVLPMSPGTLRAGRAVLRLATLLERIAHRLVDGRFVAVPPDDAGFFPSLVLGGRLRLVPAVFAAS